MLHVKQIEALVDSGQAEDAHAALEQLLALGPKNTAAWKLKAQLFESEGRFTEEGRAWEKVADIDREDPDAVSYYLRRQLEDSEYFYFSRETATGRQFTASPRSIVKFSLLGFFGCLLFLIAMQLRTTFPMVDEPSVMLSLFGVCVLIPWVAIIVAYVRSLSAISVTKGGLYINTRLKARYTAWDQVERLCLAREHSEKLGSRLYLLLIPKEAQSPALRVELTQGHTAVTARSYLIREIIRSYGELEAVALTQATQPKRRTVRL